MTVKRGQLVYNADTFMLIFSADALGFSEAMYAKLELKIQFVKNVPYPT